MSNGRPAQDYERHHAEIVFLHNGETVRKTFNGMEFQVREGTELYSLVGVLAPAPVERTVQDRGPPVGVANSHPLYKDWEDVRANDASDTEFRRAEALGHCARGAIRPWLIVGANNRFTVAQVVVTDPNYQNEAGCQVYSITSADMAFREVEGLREARRLVEFEMSLAGPELAKNAAIYADWLEEHNFNERAESLRARHLNRAVGVKDAGQAREQLR